MEDLPSRSDLEHWQLRGSGAELYERYLVPLVTSQWAVDLVARSRVQAGDRVLDVACGTGIVARIAAGKVGDSGRVAGLDLNPGMLAVARTSPKVGEVSIEWYEGSALALPFREGEFAVVLCQFGLMFLPDPALALGEMRRVLEPGGPVGVSVFAEIEQNPVALALSDALDQRLGEGASLPKRKEHALADRGALHQLFRDVGFTRVRIETVTKSSRYPSLSDFVSFQLRATPLASVLAQYKEPQRDGLTALLVEDLNPRLAGFVRGGDLVFPQVAHVVIAQDR